MTTLELIEKHGIGYNCLSDAYDLGRKDAMNDDGVPAQLIEMGYTKGRKDEQERMLSIVSRCIAHNIYNVSEGIALLNEIKEELKGGAENAE